MFCFDYNTYNGNKKCKITWCFVVYLSFCIYFHTVLSTTTTESDSLSYDYDKVFTNGWAIHIKGDNTFQRAKRIAEKYGFEKVTKVGSLDNYFHLEHPHHPDRSKRSDESKTDLLKQEQDIAWVEQQHEYKRDKRGIHHDDIIRRGLQPRFADPLWDEQWYLDDKRQSMDLDVHVVPVWNAGISGKGVVVTILDDGIEHNHTDLTKNYDPAASWDVNDNDPDPFPRYDPTNENKHGTRCAGEVAAQANNTKCGVGVAYNARVGGVRMLDGRVTDRVEAESLSLNPQYIDIYSASWGPSDDGMTVEGPGTLASAAFLNGITKGRGGLGSIYVWASGNGGRHDDSCNCDGYTASIYTLSISSSSDHGESPWYSEACSSTLATTLSSGAHGEKRIVTTDLHNQCTERHTGTSASAPLAAGIIALALEKNPKLKWRDVQHLVVHTSNWLPLKGDSDWRMNGIGLHVNEKFGFGLLDAEKLVKMADKKLFKSVPEKKECKENVHSDSKPLRWDQTLSVGIETDGCSKTKDAIRYLEHVQLILSIEYTRRGDLTIFLTSPMGTKSCLLPVRSEDSSDEGFKKWAFMTTHTWGEDPRGTWQLEIKDGGESRTNTGVLRDWQLILHGTLEKPQHQNITHPDIPLKRKAVPDDTKIKSSVQITQITYTFGSNGAPSTLIKPETTTTTTTTSTTQSSYPNYLPTQSLSQTQALSNPYALLPNAQNGAPSTTGLENEYANYNQNYNALYQHSNIPQNYIDPSFVNTNGNTNQQYDPNHDYASLFQRQTPSYNALNSAQLYQQQQQQQQQRVLSNQNNVRTEMVGRSTAWTPPNTNLQLYADPHANLWDFFGRMNKRRSSEGRSSEDIEKEKSNSLLTVLARLQHEYQRKRRRK